MTTIHTSFDLVLSGKYEAYYKKHPERIIEMIREAIVSEDITEYDDAKINDLEIKEV